MKLYRIWVGHLRHRKIESLRADVCRIRRRECGRRIVASRKHELRPSRSFPGKTAIASGSWQALGCMGRRKFNAQRFDNECSGKYSIRVEWLRRAKTDVAPLSSEFADEEKIANDTPLLGASVSRDTRLGVWLRIAEQGCFAVICATLLAVFLGWLLILHWRSEQRIEFDGIEYEEACFIVDPNLASNHELELLPGIGPTLAARIRESVASHGNFHQVDDLKRVHGIGDLKVRRLTPYIAIDSSAERP